MVDVINYVRARGRVFFSERSETPNLSASKAFRSG
jgi:hypothetical protein